MADPERPPSKTSLGVFVGVPQIVGVTLEVRSDQDFRFQVSASEVLLLASASGRLLVGDPTPGVKPYGFAGGGLVDMREGEGGGAIGTSAFFWFGGGLRVHVRRVSLFLEVGTLAGMNEDKGFDRTVPAGAIGLMIGL